MKFLKVTNYDKIKDYWWFNYIVLVRPGSCLIPNGCFLIFTEICRAVGCEEVSFQPYSKEIILSSVEKRKVKSLNLLRIGLSNKNEAVLFYGKYAFALPLAATQGILARTHTLIY